MEKQSTSIRSQNPKFAILGLSHLGDRCAAASEWSSSLSVSCFGQTHWTSPVDSADHDEKMKAAAAAAASPLESSTPPQKSHDAVIRTLSAKASRRRLASATAANRRPSRSRPPPAPAASSTPSLQVPAEVRTNQRPSHGGSLTRSSLASESLIIRPLRGGGAGGGGGMATRSVASSHRPSTRSASGSSSNTVVDKPTSRRDVLVLLPPHGQDDRRGTSTVAGRHLEVFLPSLVARQTPVETDE